MGLSYLAALVLGLGVAVVLALFAGHDAEHSDPSMTWEGRVAIGFTVVLFAGPLWLAQAGFTIAAALVGAGLWSGWLWIWLFAAPLLGASPPAARVMRAVRRALPRRAPAAYSPRGAAAVQQEANFAWAATEAEEGWELCRTPSLPASWPPEPGGPAVWFLYAERAQNPQVYEVAGPWARITLAQGESAWPVVERLSAAVQSLGVQAIVPLSADQLTRPAVSHLELLAKGDPGGRVAKALQQWRSLNGLLAAHPAVAGHLPPA